MSPEAAEKADLRRVPLGRAQRLKARLISLALIGPAEGVPKKKLGFERWANPPNPREAKTRIGWGTGMGSAFHRIEVGNAGGGLVTKHSPTRFSAASN
jgi:hypothetical protein